MPRKTKTATELDELRAAHAQSVEKLDKLAAQRKTRLIAADDAAVDKLDTEIVALNKATNAPGRAHRTACGKGREGAPRRDCGGSARSDRPHQAHQVHALQTRWRSSSNSPLRGLLNCATGSLLYGAPCIRQTFQPRAAGARHGFPVRFDLALHRSASLQRRMGLMLISLSYPLPHRHRYSRVNFSAAGAKKSRQVDRRWQHSFAPGRHTAPGHLAPRSRSSAADHVAPGVSRFPCASRCKAAAVHQQQLTTQSMS